MGRILDLAPLENCVLVQFFTPLEGGKKNVGASGHACWCRTESRFIFCEGGLCLVLPWQIPRCMFLWSQHPGWLISTALASPYCWPKHLAPLRMLYQYPVFNSSRCMSDKSFLRSKVNIHLEFKKPHNLKDKQNLSKQSCLITWFIWRVFLNAVFFNLS